MDNVQMSTASAENRQNAPLFDIRDDDVMEIWPAGSWPGKPHRRLEDDEIRELIDDLIAELEVS